MQDGQEPPAATVEVRRTHFSDVCGTIDELKRRLHEEPETSAGQPSALTALIDDALYMEERMEQRLREYEAFREQVVAIAAALAQQPGSRRDDAITLAPPLKAQLARGRVLSPEERAETIATAEAIRQVAQELENTLGRYKQLALDLERAYREIRGNRSWVLQDETAPPDGTAGDAAWMRWLPASPHRERIVRYLRAGRAHMLPPPDGGLADRPPLVQFEDGGVMPLPLVRWDDDVRNFYPADAPPHPHGRRYRDL